MHRPPGLRRSRAARPRKDTAARPRGRPVKKAAAPPAASEAEQQRLLRKAARQGRRREEIIAAAMTLASEKGLEGFTAEDVGHALAMSIPSIFYYFPGGLTELRAAAAVRRFHVALAPVLKRLESAPSGVDALIDMVRGMADVYAKDREGFGTDLDVMMRGAWSADIVHAHIQWLNEIFSTVEKKLEVDRAHKELHPDVENLRRIAMLMNQLALGIVVGDRFMRRVGGGSKHGYDALVADLCALLERGLRR